MFSSLKHPVGPDISAADIHVLNLSGTKVSFKAPRHAARVTQFRKLSCNYNIYNDMNYIHRSEKKKGFDFISCYNSEWGIHGLPIIQRHIGDLVFGISVVKTTLPGSFLQPHFVEQALAGDLNELYGPLRGAVHSPVNARLNWTIAPLKQHLWLFFRTEFPDDKTEIVDYHLPLTDEHMLRVSLTCYTYHKKANLQPLFHRISQQLIESFEVTLSNDAQQQQADAKKRWPDEQYSSYLPPFHWESDSKGDVSLFAGN
jgi:hypothetical protein